MRAPLLAVALLFTSSSVFAQAPVQPDDRAVEQAQREQKATRVARFLAGGVIGLGAHEGGHLLFDIAFDADPTLTRVSFHGLPFFAITPRADLSPRRELAISSAGFWVQHAGSEWILSAKPALRHERSPLLKGVLAFNVATSAAYAGAAFARTGPHERDTRGIADAARIDERWVGAMVLAPAVLDAWRYLHPEARWAVWTSRGLKAGFVLLLLR